MKRTILAFVSILILLAACAPQTPTPTADTRYTVTDALGRSITLDKVPERIAIVGKAQIMTADAVYMFPGVSERITSLGDTTQGEGNFIKLIDPTFTEKTILPVEVGPEQVAGVNPDLVILKSSLREKVGKAIEELGIPVIYLDFETADQYQRDLATLGQLLQNDARAQEIAAYYQSRVDGVTQTLSGLTDADKPSVLLLYYSEKDGAVAFNVPPTSWMQTWMVETAGGKPVWLDANPGGGWTKVSLEQVAAWDADTIFIVSYGKNLDSIVTSLQADPQWQELRAVKEGRLYGFASDIYSWDQPDSRWILGLQWLAGKLHPDQFPNLDITAEAQSFYTTLYGQTGQFFTEKILPTFKGSVP
jgi:iron complex transport system substrate-binding protein